jgi:hypothetical protein
MQLQKSSSPKRPRIPAAVATNVSCGKGSTKAVEWDEAV